MSLSDEPLFLVTLLSHSVTRSLDITHWYPCRVGVYACLNGAIKLEHMPSDCSLWEAQRRCYGKVLEYLDESFRECVCESTTRRLQRVLALVVLLIAML